MDMTASELSRRLDRLEAYLAADPANPRLLVDAFDVALRAAAWQRAEFHLRHALAIGVDRPDWLLREGQWLVAQGRWQEAEDHLLAVSEELKDSPPRSATLAHDLAYVDLRRGRYEAGIERLRPLVETANDAADPALETTWLRLLHRAGQASRALRWLHAREAQGMLRSGAAGVGSLIALDEGDYAASLRWAESALKSDAPPAEALVARASLALSERDALLARRLLTTALQANPQDGRVWSAMGFAHLLEQDFASARSAFDRATALMSEHIGTWHGLGWTAISQHDLPAALRAFEAALQLDRNFAESHGGLAVVFALSGEPSRSREAIARALGLDKASFSARYAEALLSGDARDAASLARLAERLFTGKRAPLGGALTTAIDGPTKNR